jgi:hypothetical protein
MHFCLVFYYENLMILKVREKKSLKNQQNHLNLQLKNKIIHFPFLI